MSLYKFFLFFFSFSFFCFSSYNRLLPAARPLRPHPPRTTSLPVYLTQVGFTGAGRHAGMLGARPRRRAPRILLSLWGGKQKIKEVGARQEKTRWKSRAPRGAQGLGGSRSAAGGTGGRGADHL